MEENTNIKKKENSIDLNLDFDINFFQYLNFIISNIKYLLISFFVIFFITIIAQVIMKVDYDIAITSLAFNEDKYSSSSNFIIKKANKNFFSKDIINISQISEFEKQVNVIGINVTNFNLKPNFTIEYFFNLLKSENNFKNFLLSDIKYTKDYFLIFDQIQFTASYDTKQIDYHLYHEGLISFTLYIDKTTQDRVTDTTNMLDAYSLFTVNKVNSRIKNNLITRFDLEKKANEKNIKDTKIYLENGITMTVDIINSHIESLEIKIALCKKYPLSCSIKNSELIISELQESKEKKNIEFANEWLNENLNYYKNFASEMKIKDLYTKKITTVNAYNNDQKKHLFDMESIITKFDLNDYFYLDNETSNYYKKISKLSQNQDNLLLSNIIKALIISLIFSMINILSLGLYKNYKSYKN